MAEIKITKNNFEKIKGLDFVYLCAERIGVEDVYKQNLENTPALLEYRRTYNRKSNEVSRDKENVKLKEDFKEWRKRAQEKIKEFKQNKITEDELKKWLDDNL